MEKFNAKVFLTVAELGSFRKAADALGYTQAGISYIIASMEEETGLSLFTRVHGGVRLNSDGEALLPYVRRYAAWEHDFKRAVEELNDMEKGTLRIQIFDSISIHWIPKIVRRFNDSYPGIRIELISEEDSLKQEQMVEGGETDCGFFLTEVHSPFLNVQPLMEENLLAVVAPDHPLARREKFPVAELGNYPYISMKYDDHTGMHNIFRKYGVEPNVAFCMDNDYAAMAMANAGLGYCIFPELLLRDAPYELRCMQFDEPQTRVISVGTRSTQASSKACAKFIEYTKQWVQEYAMLNECKLLCKP